MSASVLSLMSPHPSLSDEPSPEANPEPIEDASKSMDVEMTAQLTSMDGISTDSLSQSEEMNPFYSNKEGMDRISSSRSGMPPSVPNSYNTGSWRREHAASIGAGSDRHEPVPLENISNRGRSQSMMSVDGAVPLSAVKPGPVWPTENQLKVAYTYGIRRDDGSYTRLIPADELNEIGSERIQVSQGPEGMIILPPPQQVRPEKRMGPEEMVSSSIVNSLPPNQPRRPRRSNVPDPNDETQRRINAIVDGAPANVPAPGRRMKIYCDKWIHEGVCAFTQLGCKYKHDMPLDKATQLSLGLNHGLPAWYKRAHGVQLRTEPQQSPASTRSTSTTNSWRKGEAVTAPSSAIGAGGAPLGARPSLFTTRAPYGPSDFGPIGPPSRPPVQSKNAYDMLSSDMKTESESDDDITYTGRKR